MKRETVKLFEPIIKCIEDRKYDEASSQIDVFIKNEDEEICSYAYYLLGYINTCWNNHKKNTDRARRYLLNNLNSNYQYHNAYVLFAHVEEDKNIIERYLKQGLSRYPNHPQILYELLTRTHEKEFVISQIYENDIADFSLLSMVIEILIRDGEWSQIGYYIHKIRSNYNLDECVNNYFDLLDGYAAIFGEIDYKRACEILEKVALKDLDNTFGYAHYLGIIYIYVKSGEKDKAINYFDKLPVNNSIFDLYDGPWYFISVEFDKEYREIFRVLEKTFENDGFRCAKARCLYSLYLYYPSEIYGTYRYDESTIKNLTEYSKIECNKYIVAALFNMNCHFGNYREANIFFLKGIEGGYDLENVDAYYCIITENADVKTLQNIVHDIIDFIDKSDSFDYDIFIDSVSGALIERLHFAKQYEDIVKIADILSIDIILKSQSAFYFAYAYAEEDSPKGLKIYQKIMEEDSGNTSVLNNIGVIFEQKGDLENALIYFNKAVSISNEDLYINNVKRIQNKLKEKEKKICSEKQKEYRNMVKNVNVDFFNEIGYDETFISKFDTIKNENIRGIILRDIKECTIAIATSQVKSATILTGSIIEALLYAVLKEKGINSYYIKRKGNNVSINIEDMALNELLSVVEQEKLIDYNSFHLSHYIRDYRNFIHPAKEIRSKDNITQENVLVIWSILKRLVDELL